MLKIISFYQWCKQVARTSEKYERQYPNGFPILAALRLHNVLFRNINAENEKFKKAILNVSTDRIFLTHCAIAGSDKPNGVPYKRLLKLAGELGSLDAEFYYADLLQKSTDIRDVNESKKITQRLLELNHGPSHGYLANTLFSKKGQEKLVLHHLNIAAEAPEGLFGPISSGNANVSLAIMHAEGDKAPRDIGKAVYHYQRACHYNDAQGMAEFGKYLLGNTIGIEPDIKRGMELLREAAELGHRMAQYEVGRWYFLGIHGVEKNIHFTIEYWKMAAEQDMPVALFELGMLCIQGYQRDGWDIPQDTHLGRHFLEKFLKLYQHTSGFALFSKKAQKVLNELPKDSIKTIKIKGRKREHNAFM